MSKEIKYTILLFAVSRIALLTIGVDSRLVLQRYLDIKPISDNLYLDTWAHWDSGWYLRIAMDGYHLDTRSTAQRHNFFPLYPALMSIAGILPGNDKTRIDNHVLAGIIISNISLFVACFYLYRLVLLEYDAKTALDSVRYLFLFPTAFLLSGVLSESLFLALMLVCFYHAKLGKWYIAGVAGFFMALTRSIGVFVVLALAYEYFRRNKLSFRSPAFLWLLLIPGAYICYMIFCFYITGNFWAYLGAQKAWGAAFSNPLTILYNSVFSGNVTRMFNGVLTAAVIVLLLMYLKRIDSSYLLLAFILILVPLFAGKGCVYGLSRYLVVVFPVYIIFAKIIKDNPLIDHLLTVFMVLIQGFLMVAWCNYLGIVH